MGIGSVRKAAFVDRDGVLIHLVLNPATGDYESAHHPDDVRFVDGARQGLRLLSEAGYALVLVSNQPSHAKGKVGLEELRAVHARFDEVLRDWGVVFLQYGYCYHHPDGVVPEYTKNCDCRKPHPRLILSPCGEFGIDPATSWMIGDRASDVECGRRAGCRTALVRYPLSSRHHANAGATIEGESFLEVVDAIRRCVRPGREIKDIEGAL